MPQAKEETNLAARSQKVLALVSHVLWKNPAMGDVRLLYHLLPLVTLYSHGPYRSTARGRL